MSRARSLLSIGLMHAAQKSSPPPIPAIARKKSGTPTPISVTPVRPTVTVWIGNMSYQAIRV